MRMLCLTSKERAEIISTEKQSTDKLDFIR
jgi:hypothetical protein